ncbi:pyruvate dehydrogenase complex dihydrolipoamide acetyltransferase [Robertkochia sediminum]|uniref:pyruvate dehydrogenase complex dihydrolipoamide acetyltransferase n=1 Tax=Robertkochia sediminum TaxID=2785326 RepID=UPI001931B1A5|nr:pyruvate dehydrogenase complex dihydrolipoamide acetyltransferase [Robertkochia sediminum]MBL7472858.1 pyruvate dehydrogenase complex dihydrolipoamide acetyltransferase [Robertkochia sediminum]
MAVVVNMPRLSDTMEEGVVAKWLKNVGDKVEEGDILAEIETDKATMEFESFHEGTLLHIGIAEGEGAPVDSMLAIIGEQGEDISALLGAGAAEAAPAQETPKAEETAAAAPAAAEIPAGVEVVTMPRLSDTMEEGTVASWLKAVGDTVEEGDILAEIETDKATMEFESFYSGKLLHIGIQEGQSAPVDDVLAIIGPDGTDVAAVLASVQGGGAPAAQPAAEEKAAAAPKAPEAAPAQTETATATTTGGGRVFASPLAKKMAEDKGIDLAKVKGSGENGRIVKRDIENYKEEAPAAAAPQPAAPAETSAAMPFVPAGEEMVEEVKNSQMRKTIARRLAESKFTAPHYYLTIEVDMANAMASRSHINALPDTKVSFNDMVVKACAMALKKHPQVNTSWEDAVTKYNRHVHVGVAVAVEDGLVVPVLKFTDQMSLSQIGAQVKDLAGKARNKKLTPQEMEGSTFTVSNLGMFGIQEFTSIINQPNSAILSVGAIVQKPVVKDGQIVVGNTMKVTLACDHRTVDGATGAQFLQTLKAYLENPVTMLA